MSGRMVRYEEQAQIIDLSGLPRGVYLIKASNENDLIVHGKVVR
jgi:hypothetical protein